jgi:hypothetical protein
MEGHALLIGVNEGASHYYGDTLVLNCVDADLKAMVSLLGKVPEIGNRIQILTGKNAAWSLVKYEIEEKYSKLAENNQNDIYLVIYYTGHGVSIKKDGESYFEEFYSFYDEAISEYKIRSLLLSFSNKYKIFIVVDTCHGGGLSDWNEQTPPIYPPNTNHGHPVDIPTKEIPVNIVKNITHKVEFIKQSKNQNKYLLDGFSQDFDSFTPEADIAIFSACGKDQLTEQNLGPNQPSKFTSLITKKWKPHKSRNYYCLKDWVNSDRPPYAKSQLNLFTNSTFFMEKEAFSSTKDAKCTCVKEGFLEEISGNPVIVYQPEDEELENYTHSHGSFTFNIPTLNARDRIIYDKVIDLIETSDPEFHNYINEITVLTVVSINDDMLGTLLETRVYDMKSINCCDTPGNGYVVLITTYGSWQFKKGQRTKGKVSNSIGG